MIKNIIKPSNRYIKIIEGFEKNNTLINAAKGVELPIPSTSDTLIMSFNMAEDSNTFYATTTTKLNSQLNMILSDKTRVVITHERCKRYTDSSAKGKAFPKSDDIDKDVISVEYTSPQGVRVTSKTEDMKEFSPFELKFDLDSEKKVTIRSNEISSTVSNININIEFIDEDVIIINVSSSAPTIDNTLPATYKYNLKTKLYEGTINGTKVSKEELNREISAKEEIVNKLREKLGSSEYADIYKNLINESQKTYDELENKKSFSNSIDKYINLAMELVAVYNNKIVLFNSLISDEKQNNILNAIETYVSELTNFDETKKTLISDLGATQDMQQLIEKMSNFLSQHTSNNAPQLTKKTVSKWPWSRK